MGSSNLSGDLQSEADLPCLQDIAGVDPFFTPPVTTDSSTTASPSGQVSHDDRANNNGDDTEAVIAPSVEIIGQQLEQVSVVPNETPVAESTQLVDPGANLMSNPSSENSRSTKQIAAIHEYDLAMKVLSNVGDVEIEHGDAVGQTRFANDGESVNAAEDYWGASNVSCFIPGVTPIDAYPVCQEFVDQISMSGGMTPATTDDAAPEVVNSDVPARSEVGTETSQMNQETIAVDELGFDIKAGFEPIQIDPFNSDEFESESYVPSMRARNQNSQSAAESQQDSINLSEFVDPSKTASQSVSGKMDQRVAAEPEADENQLPTTTLDLTQTIPQLPKSHIAQQNSGSHQLFESVEQSLSDLQSINETDPEPAIEAPVASAFKTDPPLQQAHGVVLADTPETQNVPQQPSASGAEAELEWQVIKVDGLDGYDFLDLKAFDVKEAMFCPGKIFLNTETAKFQIQYQNLKLAVFAGDFEVELE